MLEFIVKYWVQVLFGLICGGFGILARHYKKLLDLEKEKKKEKFFDDVKALIESDHKKIEAASNENDKVIKEQVETLSQAVKDYHKEIKDIRNGMLSVQGRSFKHDCRVLLEDDHVITLTEYENICADHTAYNGLDGNHEGDSLFDLVTAKYLKGL